MSRFLKNSTSVLLLLALLWPSVVKIQHHHEHLACGAEHGSHFLPFQEKCSVCNFEFSVFSSPSAFEVVLNPVHTESYRNTYRAEFFAYYTGFSSSLRAPPHAFI